MRRRAAVAPVGGGGDMAVGGRGALGGADELEEVAVLDWREDEPREVPTLAIMGMVSRRRPPAPPLPPCPPPVDEGSCLGRRQWQQQTATTDPSKTKATNTEPTIRKGT